MPSILSRLRNRTLSQHSYASAQSATTPVSPPLAPQADSPTLSSSRSEPVLVDRRIVEDLPALLGSLEATQSPPGALRPPRKRSGFASLGLRSTLKDAILVQDDPHAASEKENEELPPSALVAAPSAWKGKQRQSSTSSPWSTFGRHRRHQRSPYGSPHTPSGRSSRIPSADSGALRSSSVSNVGEGQTVSNIASTASIDHPTNSRPTESSRDVSVLSTLAGSLSNRSSHSHKSTAVTFGFQSPPIHDVTLSPSQRESAEFVAYTSMPVLPLAYSTDSILSSRNTFPRRHKQRKPRSQRTIPHELADSNRFQEEGEQFHPWPPPSGRRPCLGDAIERPAIAVPHAKHESATETTVRPCSPPLYPLPYRPRRRPQPPHF
ncbi:hypothetical protein C8Q74DRAFT_915950 [Fomes fomentarius]|nr:hypothetical protein C8Q74DRAFT_915950 [Fomes fomentarius]